MLKISFGGLLSAANLSATMISSVRPAAWASVKRSSSSDRLSKFESEVLLWEKCILIILWYYRFISSSRIYPQNPSLALKMQWPRFVGDSWPNLCENCKSLLLVFQVVCRWGVYFLLFPARIFEFFHEIFTNPLKTYFLHLLSEAKILP